MDVTFLEDEPFLEPTIRGEKEREDLDSGGDVF